MAGAADFRAQIALQIRAEGKDEAQAIVQEMDRLKANMQGLKTLFNEGSVGLRDYLTTLKDLEREYVAFGGQLKTVQAAQEAETREMVAAAEKHADFLIKQDALEAEVEGRRQRRRQNAIANNVANVQAQLDQQQLIALRQIAGAQENLNQVVNVGAAYATKANQAYIGHVTAMDQGRSSAEKYSYALLNFSHAFQDAQYGVGAVLNNIPLVTTSLIQAIPKLDQYAAKVGGAAGIAGAFMITAVAANTLYNNWDKVEKFFGERGVGTLTPVVDTSKHLAHELAEASTQMEKLSNKARLSLPEMEKFRELQAKITDIEAKQFKQRADEEIRATKGAKETEAGAGFKQAIALAGGGGQARDDLVQALTNLGTRTGQQFTAQGIGDQADQLLRDAMQGNRNAIDQIQRVVSGFMPAAQRGFAQAIERTDPAQIQAREERLMIRHAEGAAAKAEADKAAAAAEKKKQEEIGMAAAGDKDVAAKDKAIADAAKAEAKAEAKAVRAAPGLARKAERAGVLAERGQIAGKLEERFGGFEGGVSAQQAGEGAERFQRMVGQGTAPEIAQTKVNELMTQFIQQNLAGQQAMNQMNGAMINNLQQAIQMQAMFQAQLMMMGQNVNGNAVRRAMPMPVIPFGG